MPTTTPRNEPSTTSTKSEASQYLSPHEAHAKAITDFITLYYEHRVEPNASVRQGGSLFRVDHGHRLGAKLTVFPFGQTNEGRSEWVQQRVATGHKIAV